MIKKIGIILFLLLSAQYGGRPQGAAPTGAAFAATQENGQPCPPECVTDSMEIVTWYPSPYNEYEELRLYPVQRDAEDCDNYKIGLMYYDHGGTPSFPDNDKMMICKGTSLGWQEILAGGVKIADDAAACDSSKEGTMRWTGLSLDVCANSAWKTIKSFASATGGIITESGGYRIHTFLNNGTFTPTGALSVEYLVVAGGGGGGSLGGGGAGGYKTGVVTVTAQDYAIIVGAGGTGYPSKTNGGNSLFASITATGGGAGGEAESSGSAASGGSGGGSGRFGSAGAASPAGQGNVGGMGLGVGTAFSGGGGGGAGGAGFNAPDNGIAGNGGNGGYSSIDNSSTIIIRGGGGGGGSYIYMGTGDAGTGGSGGGGNGGRNGLNATSGELNTGGGGGAAGYTPDGHVNGSGGSGGSGIVIIRYNAP